jgi:hypothetical protein
MVDRGSLQKRRRRPDLQFGGDLQHFRVEEGGA